MYLLWWARWRVQWGGSRFTLLETLPDAETVWILQTGSHARREVLPPAAACLFIFPIMCGFSCCVLLQVIISASNHLQVVEVSGYCEHLLTECDSKSQFGKCPRCTEAIPSEHLQKHVAERKCTGSMYMLNAPCINSKIQFAFCVLPGSVGASMIDRLPNIMVRFHWVWFVKFSKITDQLTILQCSPSIQVQYTRCLLHVRRQRGSSTSCSTRELFPCTHPSTIANLLFASNIKLYVAYDP